MGYDVWKVIGDDGYRSYKIPGRFETKDAALCVGKNWLIEMSAKDGIDPDADYNPYTFEVLSFDSEDQQGE